LVDEVKVTITHFQADDKKAGGAYCTYTGVVKKIEEFSGVITMTSGEEIYE